MQMTFTKGVEVLGTNTKLPDLSEGCVEARLESVNYLKDQSTKYGYRDHLEIAYAISIGVTVREKKEKLMISQAEGSRCHTFLLDIYKGNIPSNIDITDFVGKECTLIIKHVKSENGNTYANIVARKFK